MKTFILALVAALSLSAGYVHASPAEAKLEVVTAPAPGAEWNIVVPSDETWKIHTVRGFLVTDATVANREVRFVVDSPTGLGTYVFVPSATTQGASESRTYMFLASGGYRGVGTVNVGVVVGIGDVLVPAGARIRVSTTNIQAGDAWSDAFLIVEKFKN